METATHYYYNKASNHAVTNDAANEFIADIETHIEAGYGFVPFIGAGLSAPSGIPLVWEIESYLHRCIGMSLGLVTPGKVPWNPRTHQWPSFESRDHGPLGTWEGMIRHALSSRRISHPWDPENRVFQEALGALAEWRTALLFLSRIVAEKRGAERERRHVYMLDAPRQDVIDSAIREIMRGKRPTLGHRMLAALGGLLRLDIIVTTNFDDLLEQAFAAARNPVTVFGMHLSGDLPPYAALAPQRSLIKLHGDRHSLRADYTLDAVPQDTDRSRFLEYLLSADGHKDFFARNQPQHRSSAVPNDLPKAPRKRLSCGNHLLVMGVSASERRTRALIEHAWRELDDPFSVYWLCHTEDDVNRVIAFSNEVFQGIESVGEENVKTRSRILRHTNLGLLFLQLFQTIRRSVPTTGIIFPTASRLAIPPVFVRAATDQEADGGRSKLEQAKLEQAQGKLVKSLSERLDTFKSVDFSGYRILLVTSEAEIRGVTSVGAELFEAAEKNGAYCVWLEMNDITTTDDLFEQLLDATYYRLGSENWLPVFVASDPHSRADEVRRLIKPTRAPWTFFLNARERPGSNVEDDNAEEMPKQDEFLGNGWLDGIAMDDQKEQQSLLGLLSALCARGEGDPCISVVLLTTSRSDSKKMSIGINQALCSAGLVKVADVLPTSCIGYTVSEIPNECLGWTSKFAPLPLECAEEDQVKRIARDVSELRETTLRRRFLLSLLLMQRTRFVASLSSEAFVATISRPNGDNLELVKPSRDEALKWVDELESTGLVRRKSGGFIWLRADSRNSLRRVLAHRDYLKAHILEHVVEFQKCKIDPKRLEDWAPEDDAPDIHWNLAKWYRRVMSASDSPGALFEAMYHACMSARTLPRTSGFDCMAAPRVMAERINWASALLQTHGFMVQTRGYSRGSCRRLESLRDIVASRIEEAISKIVTAEKFDRAGDLRSLFNPVYGALLRLRLRCTEIMRAIAREVGEGVKAYDRHREIRCMLAGHGHARGYKGKEKDLWQVNYQILYQEMFPDSTRVAERKSKKPISQKANASPPDKLAVEDRAFEWLRYWRWLGMLAMGSKSHEEALRSLYMVIASIIFGFSDEKQSDPTCSIRSHELVATKNIPPKIKVIADAVGRAIALVSPHASVSKAWTFLGSSVASIQQVRLELLRTVELIIDCLLRDHTVRQRVADLDPEKAVGVTGEFSFSLLDRLINLAIQLCETILSEEQDTENPHTKAAMLCHSRLHLHASINAARVGNDAKTAMKLLTDAEASSNLIDIKRFGSDRALVELYRAEIQIHNALNAFVFTKGDGSRIKIRFKTFVQQQSVFAFPTDNSEAWQVRGANIRQEHWLEDDQQAVASFRTVKALVRDAIRFIDRADGILSQRRRNVFWTTWHFHRRLQAISLLLWATVFEQGTPIAYLGHEAAQPYSDTIADEILTTSQRIIRQDAYRLATIIESYAACAKAVHFRLILEPKAERLEERQVKMRENLRNAVESLRVMLIRRKAIGEEKMKENADASLWDDAKKNEFRSRFACSQTVEDYVELVCKTVSTVIDGLRNEIK